MPRFVILTHDFPVLHWDLLLEKEAALRAWRLSQPPDQANVIAAEAIPDHRLAYLDYEGPVSGNRGSVSRWDAGTYDVLSKSEGNLEFRLEGQRLRAVCRLESGPESCRLHVQELLPTSAAESPLMAFYSGRAPIPGSGASWDEIVTTWSDGQWEFHHDFIQWLFPLRTPSSFNDDAPVLTEADRQAFRQPLLRQRVIAAFQRFLAFLGLEGVPPADSAAHWTVRKGAAFELRKSVWRTRNHNWLRVTRCLASLKLLDLHGPAAAFFEGLTRLRQEGYGSEQSFEYWQAAAEGRVE